MVKCQIIFFPLLYYPNSRERLRLQNIQDAIKYTHQNIRTKARNDYEIAALKFNFYKRVRMNMRLVGC